MPGCSAESACLQGAKIHGMYCNISASISEFWRVLFTGLLDNDQYDSYDCICSVD